MEVVADQVEKDEKKKKKTWWGGTKKSKPDATKLSAAELDLIARDASVVGGGGVAPSVVDTPLSVASDGKAKKSTLKTDKTAAAKGEGDLISLWVFTLSLLNCFSKVFLFVSSTVPSLVPFPYLFDFTLLITILYFV